MMTKQSRWGKVTSIILTTESNSITVEGTRWHLTLHDVSTASGIGDVKIGQKFAVFLEQDGPQI